MINTKHEMRSTTPIQMIKYPKQPGSFEFWSLSFILDFDVWVTNLNFDGDKKI